MEVKEVKDVGVVMESQRLSPRMKLILVSVIIVGLLLFSGFLATMVRDNAARQSAATMAQNRLNTMLLTIRADIAASMLPAHDYLIVRNPGHDEHKEYEELAKQIEMDFNVMQIDQHFEPIDHQIIDEAFDQFRKLEKIEEEIFALRGGAIDSQGPQKMKTMHVYQDAILNKLGSLNNLELAEYENFVLTEQDANRRSIILIAATAAFALTGAVIIGYLGSKT